MSESIINTLGFNVDEALSALARLDTALKTSGTAFATYGNALAAFNASASAALRTMQELSAAASKVIGMAAPAAPAATAAPASQLWLPPGVKEDIAGVNSALTQTGQIASGVPGQIKPIAAATEDANKQAHGMALSWEMIGRIMITQAIVRAMSAIRDAIKDAFTSAMDFQKALGEIQAIAPRIQASMSDFGDPARLETLAREVADFSKAFDIPLPKAAEGVYQIMSDQFTNVADRANVMQASMELAKLGVADFDKAATLITGTLNAYGMSTIQARQLSAEFFETVKLGHVRVDELAQVMGQIAPIAAQLGVSVRESNAAMVSLTIGGLSYAKAATAVRGGMMALLKPSDDLKKIVREMGFGSPEQLVAARGYQGALQAISDAVDGMGGKIAGAVPNVRALLAEFRLSSEEGAKKYIEAMEAMKKVTPEAMATLRKEMMSIDANALSKSWNEFKVNMTRDFGEAMVSIGRGLMEFIGGADKLTAAIMAIAAAAVPVGVAILGLAGAFTLMHIAMGPIGWAILGITTALGTLAGVSTYQSMRAVQGIQKEANARQEAIQERMQALNGVLAKELEVQQEADRVAHGKWEEGAAVIRGSYIKALDEVKEKNREIIDSSRLTMDAMIAAQERVVAAYRSAAEANARAIDDSKKRSEGLTDKIDDKKFKDLNKGMDEGVQAANNLFRAMDLAKNAANELANAKTPDDIARALKDFQRASEAASRAEQLADKSSSGILRQRAQEAILSVMRQQLEAEKELQGLQARAAEANAAKAAKEQERLASMRESMKAILEGLNSFDKKGEPLKGPELDANKAKLEKALKELRENFLAGDKLDPSALLDMDKLGKRIALAVSGGVSEAQIDKLFATPTAIQQLHDDIQKGMGPMQVLVEAVMKDPALGKQFAGKSAEDISNLAGQEQKVLQDRQMKFAQTAADLRKSEALLNEQLGDMTAGLDKFAEGIRAAAVVATSSPAEMAKRQFTPDKIEALADLVTAIKSMAAGDASPAAYKRLTKLYEEYKEVAKPSAETEKALKIVIDAANQAQQAWDAVKKGKEGLQGVEKDRAEIERKLKVIDDALKAAQSKAESLKGSTEGAEEGAIGAEAALGNLNQVDAGGAIDDLWILDDAAWDLWGDADGAGAALDDLSATSMGGLIGEIDTAISAMWDLADAAYAAAAAAAQATSAQYAAHGGVARYFASGGNVGMDTINAKLSPGEVVINPRSARNFASQLTAMNAGVQPVYRSDGGSVTNIGDINVSVTGGGSSRQTARSIASELRRELRRGTSSL